MTSEQDGWAWLVSTLTNERAEVAPTWPVASVQVVVDGRSRRETHEALRTMHLPSPNAPLFGPSDAAVVRQLQQRGPTAGYDLARWMKLPYKVAREHLLALAAQGLIRNERGHWIASPSGR